MLSSTATAVDSRPQLMSVCERKRKQSSAMLNIDYAPACWVA